MRQDLTADRIRAGLATTKLGRTIEAYATLPSTNDRALDLLDEGAPHGTLIVADRQTAGRGRRGHQWHSAAGLAVYASLILRGARATPSPTLLVAATGVGIAEGLERAAAVSCQIKWPNDVWIRDRKVAGILVEARSFRADRPAFVVGFGVNVAHRENDFPTELRASATSLAIETNVVLARDVVLRAVLVALEPLIDAALDAAPAPDIHRRYRDRSLLLGRRVALSDGETPLVGTVVDLSAVDGLLLRTDDGVMRHVRSEHAHSVRPL